MCNWTEWSPACSHTIIKTVCVCVSVAVISALHLTAEHCILDNVFSSVECLRPNQFRFFFLRETLSRNLGHRHQECIFHALTAWNLLQYDWLTGWLVGWLVAFNIYMQNTRNAWAMRFWVRLESIYINRSNTKNSMCRRQLDRFLLNFFRSTHFSINIFLFSFIFHRNVAILLVLFA